MSEAANDSRTLEGRAALVTGASSGLGRATAIALTRAGADVAIVARSKEELESVGEEVTKIGRRALALPIDLASANETAEAVRRTVEALGHVDVLVNAAGTDVPSTVEELDIEGWDRLCAKQRGTQQKKLNTSRKTAEDEPCALAGQELSSVDQL